MVISIWGVDGATSDLCAIEGIIRLRVPHATFGRHDLEPWIFGGIDPTWLRLFQVTRTHLNDRDRLDGGFVGLDCVVGVRLDGGVITFVWVEGFRLDGGVVAFVRVEGLGLLCAGIVVFDPVEG